MTLNALTRTPETTPGRADRTTTRLVVLVGFDGSAPAQNALDYAARILQAREGVIEVLFVSHLATTAAWWGPAYAEMTRALDDQARALADEVQVRLEGEDHPWHFQHRVGTVTAELLAVASELAASYGESADVIIVVGGPAHVYHHFVGSVAASLVHTDRFPVVVVP